MLCEVYQFPTNVRQPLGYADVLWLSKQHPNNKDGSRLNLRTPFFPCSTYQLSLISNENADVIREANCHLDYLDEQLEELEKSPYDINEQITSETASDLLEIEFKLENLKKRLKALLWK